MEMFSLILSQPLPIVFCWVVSGKPSSSQIFLEGKQRDSIYFSKSPEICLLCPNGVPVNSGSKNCSKVETGKRS
ncbi:Hypothetical predicted protein [Podarcis lilfordi]|nr:Hypothetical predicted protein [Podarcis lilfordi]